jgi:hypothetical protein
VTLIVGVCDGVGSNSIIISNAHPNVQLNILNISQLFMSTNFNIISGELSKIGGITALYFTVGGTGPGSMTPSKVSLFPYTSDM